MANLLTRLRARDDEWARKVASERSGFGPFSVFYDGMPGALLPTTTLPGSPAESIGEQFEQRIARVRDGNGVVAAAVLARSLLVSQIRFVWRDEISGRLFGNGDLDVLERPGSDSRPRLLARIEEDACYAGNAFVLRTDNGRLYRLRPDWVDLIIGSDGSPDDVMRGADAEVVGYRFWPGGDRRGTPQSFTLGEIMHFAPEAHPTRVAVGASWVTSILRDVIADGQASHHIEKFFENAATSNMVVKAPEGTTLDQFKKWRELFDEGHRGTAQAWKNIYVSAGTDVQVVGSALADLDLKQLTGAFESRIALRSRVPSSVLGTREGMQGSALNAGNYQQVRRLWADSWFSPYADMLCAAFEQIVPPPSSFVELTYQRDRVLFLQEDQKDAAEIAQTQSSAIRSLVEAGYDPASVVDAVTTGDFTKLRHTGVFSVQLQPPSNGQAPQEGADV